MLLSDLLQLSDGARPAYAAGNDDRLNPFFSCQADDLRSEVRMKCVENEQVSLEDLRI